MLGRLVCMFVAMADELVKIHESNIEKVSAKEKEAIFETLRHGAKALKGALLGGTKLRAAPGAFQAQRKAAVAAGDDLMAALNKRGIKTHRARVKSPSSIEAKGLTEVPDDLLGMQIYGKGPESVKQTMDALKAQGVTGLRADKVVRPGYHGVNIKGMSGKTPMEMQISPGRMSNIGQQMEHSLAYKAKTEAPFSNFIDRWFGKKVAPKMVSSGSWVPQVAG